MNATETDITIETELGRVVDWRLRELLRAGYGAGRTAASPNGSRSTSIARSIS